MNCLRPLITQSLPCLTARVCTFEDLSREPLLGRYHPFALPVVADERNDDVIDEVAARLPHEDLLFGEGHGGSNGNEARAVGRRLGREHQGVYARSNNVA